MYRVLVIVSVLLFGLGLAACGGDETPTPDIEAVIATAVAGTVAAQPVLVEAHVAPAEATPYPTYTLYPTYTPYPTPVVEVTATVTDTLVTEEPTVTPAETEVAEVEVTTEATGVVTSTAVAAETPAAETASPGVTPPITSTTSAPAPRLAVRPKDGARMVFVPGGEFMMGASSADLAAARAGGPPKLAGGDEQPQHAVEVPAFWIDQTEVTNEQFSNFVNLTGYKTTAELEGYGTSDGEEVEGAAFYHPQGMETGIDDKASHPVVQVSWQDAKTYCEWVGARLPGEAEWEKAARGAANDRVFPWGNDLGVLPGRANYCDASCPYEDGRDPNQNDGVARTAPVGSFPAGASPYGALDMAGNVWEWVDSSYLGYPGNAYEQAADFNEYFRVVRGGSWDNTASILRSTFRQPNEPRTRSDGTGFRCAVSADEIESAALEEVTAETSATATPEPAPAPAGEGVPQPVTETPAAAPGPTAQPASTPTVEAAN